MVSIGPYSESNLSAYDRIKDAVVAVEPPHDTILGLLKYNYNFSKFMALVERAGLERILSEPQANMTVFVPSNTYMEDIDMGKIDRGTARSIVNASIIPGRVLADVLTSSKDGYYETRMKTNVNRLHVTNDDGQTVLNGQINVIYFNINRSNGIVHITDKRVRPIMT
jgi:uncharacterized surface protein with fasciclin (FAS1) repeats